MEKRNHISVYLIFSILLAFAQAAQTEDTLICEDSEQCPGLYYCIDGICQHKYLFPLSTREIISTILLMILSGLANAGGLGGGALLSPILLIGFDYEANKSIMIIYSIVFGGAMGNFLNLAFKRD
jgi:hypothetical protein